MSKFTLSDALPQAQSSVQNPNASGAGAAAAQGSAADGVVPPTVRGYPDAGTRRVEPSGAGANAAHEAGSSAPPTVGSSTLLVRPETKRLALCEGLAALSVLPPPKRSRGARREAPATTAAVFADTATVALSGAAPHGGRAARRKASSPRTCAESLASMASGEVAADAADDDEDLGCATLDAPASPVTVREDTPHPDDAPPDEAIGQQRCDEPPVRVVGELELADEDTETTRASSTPRESPPPTPSSSDSRGACASADSVLFTDNVPAEEELRRRALLSLRPKLHKDHSAFAKLIALKLERCYALERVDRENVVVQWFDRHHRVWVRGGGARALHEVVTNMLHRMFPELSDEVRTIFGNKGFVSPIVDLLKNYLERDSTPKMPPLDGEQTRGLLRFSCGNVLNFHTGEVRPCRPEDRISLCTGYEYRSWEATPETKTFIAELCGDLNRLWNEGADVEDLQNASQRLERAFEASTLYRVLYQLFEDHSMGFWLLRQSVRAVAGLGGFEELLFLVDPRGANGKGTWLALLKTVLGTSTNGYYGTLEYAKHFVGYGLSRTGVNNPDIAARRGR